MPAQAGNCPSKHGGSAPRYRLRITLMTLIKSILTELIGLLVDDWVFALSLLAWVGVCALPSWRSNPELDAEELFLGLAVLTLAFVARRAARKK